MGDRVSVSLVEDGGQPGSHSESVVVCAHWGGREFPGRVRDFLAGLKRADGVPADGSGMVKGPHGGGISTPQTRMDPPYTIAQVIAEFSDEVYVGKDMDDVDNSDNGHFRIYVPSLKMEGPFWRKGWSPAELEAKYGRMAEKAMVKGKTPAAAKKGGKSQSRKQ